MVDVNDDDDDDDGDGDDLGAELPKTFPMKLHVMLDSSDPRDVYGWSDDGQSFWIADKAVFMKKAKRKGICDSVKFGSFVRQTGYYKFKRIAKGKGKELAQFGHPEFLRGQPDLAERMERKRGGRGGERDHIDQTPGQDPTLQQLQATIVALRQDLEVIKHELRSIKETCKEQCRAIARLKLHCPQGLSENSQPETDRARSAPHTNIIPAYDIPITTTSLSASTLRSKPSYTGQSIVERFNSASSSVEALPPASRVRNPAITVQRITSVTTSNTIKSPALYGASPWHVNEAQYEFAIEQNNQSFRSTPYRAGISGPEDSPVGSTNTPHQSNLHSQPVVLALPHHFPHFPHSSAVHRQASSAQYVSFNPASYTIPRDSTVDSADDHPSPPATSSAFQHVNGGRQSISDIFTFEYAPPPLPSPPSPSSHVNHPVGTIVPPIPETPGPRPWLPSQFRDFGFDYADATTYF